MFNSLIHKKALHEITNITKYIHGWQHVGYQKQQINKSTREAKCSMCNQVENKHHYHTCTNDEISEIIKKRVKELDDIVKDQNILMVGLKCLLLQ